MSPITKEQLKKMYGSMTNKEMSRELGVSEVTLVKYLKDAGVQLKGKGNRRKLRIV